MCRSIGVSAWASLWRWLVVALSAWAYIPFKGCFTHWPVVCAHRNCQTRGAVIANRIAREIG